ncbi:unnamed protein product [Ilex paraguariensis]
MSVSDLRTALAGPPDILVSTPACVQTCLSKGVLQPKFVQESLSSLILDEADLLLSYGYEDDLKALTAHVPRCCQCLLMSATSSADVEKLKKLILHNPYILTLPEVGEAKDEIIPQNVQQFWISCSAHDKLLHILALLKLELLQKKVLIFTNSIDMSFRLKLFFEQFGIKSVVLNAELPQNSRLHILEEFNAGLFDYLIATDSIQSKEKGQADGESHVDRKKSKKHDKKKLDSEFGVVRGIDFKNVHTVINFEMPPNATGYVHRIGRTGRAYNTGASVSLVSPEEMEIFEEIKSILGENESKDSNFIAPFPLLSKNAVESLRYRAEEITVPAELISAILLEIYNVLGEQERCQQIEDVARSVTKIAVRESRAQDLRNEILNSEKLKAHFEDNPRDLDLLKHDKMLSKKAPAPHLRDVPEYLLDPTTQEARKIVKLARAAMGNSLSGRHKGLKGKFRKSRDPLKSFSAEAAKQASRVDSQNCLQSPTIRTATLTNHLLRSRCHSIRNTLVLPPLQLFPDFNQLIHRPKTKAQSNRIQSPRQIPVFQMLRTCSSIRAELRSLSQTLTYLPQVQSSLPSTFKVTISPSHSIRENPSSPIIPLLSSPFSHSRPLHRRQDDYDEDSNRDPTSPPKLFVVQPRLRPDTLLQAKLNEGLNLANSLEEQRDGFYDTEFSEKELPPHVIVQNPAARSPRADTYFGPGTVQTVKCHLNGVESEGGVDAVFVNAILSGIQQRNLERAWNKPVLDRVGLIVEIFNAHAQTKEAKLQAELAALMYKRTRLVRVRGPNGRYTFGEIGEAEVVSARGRGSGGRGFISGAGETELQLQRRRILERRNQLLYEIKEVRRTRALQRAARKRHGGTQGQEMVTVAVVGYTNAGKSTLVSTLSDSYLYSDDRLFATVDTKLRSVILPSGRKVLLSDTVGFISDLPVQLVEAFQATLEEVVEADLLVHVLDSSAPNLDEQRQTVLQVLEQIGVSKGKLQNMIEVWNKIDLQEEMRGNEYDEDEVSCFSGAEDDDYSAEDDDNNGDIKCELSSGELKETMDDHQDDYSDGWLSSGDGLETWGDHDGSYVGAETPDNQQKDSSKDLRIIGKVSQSQPESVPYIKTSARMGVGLQELLEHIDERLKSQKVLEKSIFDRKWRPPRTEDTGIAVEL